jgi:hypothetical protein
MSHTAFGGGLGYEGKVTLTLKSNGRTLKSKTYKNKGTAQLFKFLGYCLIDSFEDVKALIPNKILLLYNNAASKGNSPEFANATDIVPQTDWKYLAQIPTVINEPNQVRVIYSFEVAKAEIFGPFNQVALYGVGINDIYDFSAYYYLTDASGAFEVHNAEDWSATTVLLIEWELSLSNKNTETNNRAEENK